MKNFKNLFIFILIILCILGGFLIYKTYQIKNNEKNIIITAVVMNDNKEIQCTLNNIFKLDSTGKCISTKSIMSSTDVDVFKTMIANNSIPSDSGYYNPELKDYTFYIDNNNYNGLNESEIKNKVYNEFKDRNSQNQKNNIYFSISEF